MKRIEEPKNMLGHVVGLIAYIALIMLAGLLVILMAPVWGANTITSAKNRDQTLQR